MILWCGWAIYRIIELFWFANVITNILYKIWIEHLYNITPSRFSIFTVGIKSTKRTQMGVSTVTKIKVDVKICIQSMLDWFNSTFRVTFMRLKIYINKSKIVFTDWIDWIIVVWYFAHNFSSSIYSLLWSKNA